MYRIAYDPTVAKVTTQKQHACEVKKRKDVFLNGKRQELLTIIWERLNPIATYNDTVTTTIECQVQLEVKRTTESKNFVNAQNFEKAIAKEPVKQKANM